MRKVTIPAALLLIVASCGSSAAVVDRHSISVQSRNPGSGRQGPIVHTDIGMPFAPATGLTLGLLAHVYTLRISVVDSQLPDNIRTWDGKMHVHLWWTDNGSNWCDGGILEVAAVPGTVIDYALTSPVVGFYVLENWEGYQYEIIDPTGDPNTPHMMIFTDYDSIHPHTLAAVHIDCNPKSVNP